MSPPYCKCIFVQQRRDIVTIIDKVYMNIVGILVCYSTYYITELLFYFSLGQCRCPFGQSLSSSVGTLTPRLHSGAITTGSNMIIQPTSLPKVTHEVV